MKNVLGETIKYDGKSYTVIGVVKDMLTQSPYDPIDPAIYFMDGWKGVLTIRLATNLTASQSLEKIKPVFKKYNPKSDFSYSFVDEEYGKKFMNEERIGSLATFFAALAIFISCLGLFGLASFVADKADKRNWCAQSAGRFGIYHMAITVERICVAGSDLIADLHTNCILFHEQLVRELSISNYASHGGSLR